MSLLQIEIRNSSYDKKNIILKKVDIKLNKHGLYFVSGRNGSGKSTLFKSLLGDIDVEVHKVDIDNTIIKKRSDKIVCINDEFVGYEFLKVKEYLVYISLLFNVKVTELMITNLLSELELIDYNYKLIKDLSQGNKQKLAFIATIITNSEIILFDEAFEHIDKYAMEVVKRKLTDLSNNHFIFLISHTRILHELSNEELIVKDGEIHFESH
ncbi:MULTISPECIES: ATP-binding cassette domain-containing protein [Enterococcus]|uniref:ATP-binding cassette domain-containing protein n=1 Tax=Enterococcus TaxID=1350 RepID=UPI001927DFD4|nr:MULTISPECIES: ATP-binding cassette domain-containing protein [Enterococcus]MDV2932562.1 ATP-binding cassette domain-containing protein [Enterococcus faecalis]